MVINNSDLSIDRRNRNGGSSFRGFTIWERLPPVWAPTQGKSRLPPICGKLEYVQWRTALWREEFDPLEEQMHRISVSEDRSHPGQLLQQLPRAGIAHGIEKRIIRAEAGGCADDVLGHGGHPPHSLLDGSFQKLSRYRFFFDFVARKYYYCY